MSDLADLAFDVAGDLPLAARKVIDTALTSGWNLNPPGMTMVLRLNHPTDDLAQPVYICWVVGRTPTGRMSFKFESCGTRGLVPLTGADLLEYLQDPTVAYTDDDDIAAADALSAAKVAAKDDENRPPWDTRADVVTNLGTQLGAKVLRIEQVKASELMAEQKLRLSVSASPDPKAPKPSRALRVQIPKG